MRGVLYLFAKEPAPGRVKTRLTPPLTELQAARLAEAMLADTLARVCAGAAWEVVMAVEPDGGGPVLERLCARHRLARVEQGTGDLGERMGRVMTKGHERAVPVVLMGADTPDVPISYVGMALDSLSSERVVVGPSRDGGYYLIGASAPVPALFAIDAPWSSSDVLAATTRQLDRLSIRPFLLPGWEDVDDAASLSRLALRLREGFSEAEHTLTLLEELARDGVRL
ncbi:MAG TPA: TIGR04282 family arsenosugar biosynthesis glycosyltransferase [Candidatus Binatia bacterium]|nr:TIGR04282 family arsenosugar biosynthesis glycosyltransferase [Candidatus Binatia bacterium]